MTTPGMRKNSSTEESYLGLQISLIESFADAVTATNVTFYDLLCLVTLVKKKLPTKRGNNVLIQLYLVDVSCSNAEDVIIYEVWNDAATSLFHQGVKKGSVVFICKCSTKIQHAVTTRNSQATGKSSNKRVLLCNGTVHLLPRPSSNAASSTRGGASTYAINRLPMREANMLELPLLALDKWISSSSSYAHLQYIDQTEEIYGKVDCFADIINRVQLFDIHIKISMNELRTKATCDDCSASIRIQVYDCNNDLTRLKGVSCGVLQAIIRQLEGSSTTGGAGNSDNSGGNSMVDTFIDLDAKSITVGTIFERKITSLLFRHGKSSLHILRIVDESNIQIPVIPYSNPFVQCIPSTFTRYDELMDICCNPQKLLRYVGSRVKVTAFLRGIVFPSAFVVDLIEIGRVSDAIAVTSSTSQRQRRFKKQRCAEVTATYKTCYLFIGQSTTNTTKSSCSSEYADSYLKVTMSDESISRLLANIPASLAAVSLCRKKYCTTATTTATAGITAGAGDGLNTYSLPTYDYSDACDRILLSLRDGMPSYIYVAFTAATLSLTLIYPHTSS